MDVVRLNIWGLVGWFVVYIVLHVIIGVWKNNVEKIENPTEDERAQQKWSKIAFKWFPFVYLIIVLIGLMAK